MRRHCAKTPPLGKMLLIQIQKIVERLVNFCVASRHHVAAIGECNECEVGETVLYVFYFPKIYFLILLQT